MRDRAAMRALFAIDAAMGDVVRTSSDPMLGAIRLAWWRERLEALGTDAAVPAEPRLQAAARELLPRGIAGHDLAALEDGWRRLFDPFPWDFGTAEAICSRGRLLFGLGARVMSETSDDIETAGALWALADVARHCSDADSRELLLDRAKTFARGLTRTRVHGAVRPLSMLAAVAARDCVGGEPLEREGSPRRAAAMLMHRLTGRLTGRFY